MLAKAREKLTASRLFHLDLTGDLSELTGKFDRIVSSYVLHEFDLDTKVRLLEQLCHHLTAGGFIALGDIAFPNLAARDAARARFRDVWDDNEFYWLADRAQAACESLELGLDYQQVSHCAAVMTVRKKL